MSVAQLSRQFERPFVAPIEAIEARIAAASERVISDICALDWSALNHDELVDVAWVCYYLSVQFRENVEIARGLHPLDESLAELERGERDTDNLSPCPGVVAEGERVDHDEFLRRALLLEPIDDLRRRRLQTIGRVYLAKARGMDAVSRASSLPSYEYGGLSKVFAAMLCAEGWDGPSLQAFRHFLVVHVARHRAVEGRALRLRLSPNPRVLELWCALKNSLLAAAPRLAREQV
jgi:hypothetical protein